MTTKNGSAEIYELDEMRDRIKTDDILLSGYEHSGAYLAALRVRMELTIEELAERTNIRSDFLIAIEELNVKALPNKAFALGFVKGYARELGVAPDMVVTQFRREAGYDEVETRLADEVPTVPEPAAGDDPHGGMSLLAMAVILLFILWCGYQITQPQRVKEIVVPTELPRTAIGPANAVLEENGQEPGQATDSESPAAGIDSPVLPQMVEAQLIERIEPVYPRRCETGAAPTETVEVLFTITAAGGIAAERVVASTNDCFDRAAINAVRRWQFSPRTVDGVAQNAYEQRFVFSFQKP